MKTTFNLRKYALAALCAFTLSPALLFAGNTAKTVEERGIIKSVDNKTHQLVVTDQKTKSTGTFQWNEQTRFTEQNKTVNASVLKEGMSVHLSYAAGSPTPTLSHVNIAVGKEHKPSAATPSAQRKS